jgi:hypothetical protein
MAPPSRPPAPRRQALTLARHRACSPAPLGAWAAGDGDDVAAHTDRPARRDGRTAADAMAAAGRERAAGCVRAPHPRAAAARRAAAGGA